MKENFVFKNGGLQKRMPVESNDAATAAGNEPMKVCKGCGRNLPLSAFALHDKSKDGHMSECKECRRRKSSKASKGNPLEKFTARELMHELNRRGYDGEISYVEVHKIRLSDM